LQAAHVEAKLHWCEALPDFTKDRMGGEAHVEPPPN
jgi:hypothetical protein